MDKTQLVICDTFLFKYVSMFSKAAFTSAELEANFSVNVVFQLMPDSCDSRASPIISIISTEGKCTSHNM